MEDAVKTIVCMCVLIISVYRGWHASRFTNCQTSYLYLLWRDICACWINCKQDGRRPVPTVLYTVCLGHRPCGVLGKMMTVKVVAEHPCRSLPSLWKLTALMLTTTSRQRGHRWGNHSSSTVSLQLHIALDHAVVYAITF